MFKPRMTHDVRDLVCELIEARMRMLSGWFVWLFVVLMGHLMMHRLLSNVLSLSLTLVLSKKEYKEPYSRRAP